jgi:peptidoglycan hydrolase CwlO-like protein
MITINELSSDEYFRLMQQALDGTGTSGGNSTTPREKPPVPKEFEQLVKSAQNMTRGFNAASEQQSKLNKLFKSAADDYQQLQDTIDALDDSLGELGTAAEISARSEIVEAQKAALRSAARDQIAAKSQAEFSAAFGKMISGMGSTIKSSIGNIQGSSDGIGASSALLGAEVALAGGGLQAAASAAGGVGTAMSVMGGKTGKAGVALSLLSVIAGTVAGGLTALAQTAITVLTTETIKQIASFQQMSSAGANFTNGMSGMMAASSEAEISIKSMSEIVKNNNAALYTSGVSIADGTKKIANTLKDPDLKNSLANLGYTITEQGGLVADTMSQLQLAGVNIQALTGTQLGQATKEYATNLRTIAAITGDDARARMQQAREASANAAVQVKLDAMSADERTSFMEGLATIPAALRTAVMQQKFLGTVVDKSSAILMAQVPAVATGVKNIADQIQNGAVGVGTATAIMKQGMLGSAKSMEALGQVQLAGISGDAAAVSGLFNQVSLEFQKGVRTPDQVDQVKTDISGAMNTTDATTKVLSGIQISGEKLTSTLEKAVTPHLAEFGELLAANNQLMIKAISKVGEAVGSVKSSAEGKDSESLADNATKVGELAQGVGLAMTGLGALVAATGVGVVPGAAIAAAGGATMAIGTGISMAAGLAKSKGLATGGISTGPSEGYQQLLHGTELVVPMSGGTLDTGSIGYAHMQNMLSSQSSIDRSTGTGARAPSSPVARSNTPDPTALLGTMSSMIANLVNSNNITQSQNSAVSKMTTDMLSAANITSSMVPNLSTTAGIIVSATDKLVGIPGSIGNIITSTVQSIPVPVLDSAITGLRSMISSMIPKPPVEPVVTTAAINVPEPAGMGSPNKPMNMNLVPMTDLFAQQLMLMKDAMAKQDELISILSDNRDYTRRLANSMG